LLLNLKFTNHKSFIVSVLFDKTGGGEGGAYFRGKAIILKFNFDHQEGQLFERGVHLMGDSNSRIHGTCTCILNLKFKYMFSVLTESA